MFYEVVLNGSNRGQDIRNTLFYRTGLGLDMSGFTFAGAEALAGNVLQEIVPNYLSCLPNTYRLDTIDVRPMNDTFQLVYQNPFQLVVGQTGTQSAEANAPATCVIIRFNLEATAILANGIKPPKRGYIAVGPVLEAWSDPDGYLNGPFWNDPNNQYKKLALSVSQNLEQLIPVPASWFPVRMKRKRNLIDLLTPMEAYADVSSAVAQHRISWRRSRMPES